MEKIFMKARAKVNITLDILDKRPDNYHNLKSVMQTISLYDELFIEKTDSGKIELECNVESINNKSNIVYKVCELLKEEYDIIDGIKIKLIKHIPIEAGLRRRECRLCYNITCIKQNVKFKN